MDGLSRTDSREVAVALIGEDDIVGVSALYAGSNCRSASVSGFDHVALEIIVSEYRAADRCDADCLPADVKLVESLGDQSVDDSVRTSGAVMEGHGGKGFRSVKYYHQLRPPAIFSISARTSAGDGITPPVRPKNVTGFLHSVATLTSSTI